MRCLPSKSRFVTPIRIESMPADKARSDASVAPLIAHVVYRFDIGGLENGLVNLINHIPEYRFRHAIICLADYTDFARRIRRRDVELIALHKPPGNSIKLHFQLWYLFRKLKPAIVHTRNLAALEAQAAAALAGIKVRVHGEHGRDVNDLDGFNRRYQWVRRLYRPFVQHYIALSHDLQNYLIDRVRIDVGHVTQLYNGVDTEKFRPSVAGRGPLPHALFNDPSLFVFGTVGRMQAVKDQITLARAFVRAIELAPDARARLRLVIIGDGPKREPTQQVLDAAGMQELAWLPGARDDVAELLPGFDVFVLPSLAEGISNTILEAMACGLPVLATRVGGNPELVDATRTGELVPAADVEAMAHALLRYLREPLRAREQGSAARQTTLDRFSLDRMVTGYMDVYDRLLMQRT
jgi:sugar transferase (PEP-CTERM/EpsH1 system associated)